MATLQTANYFNITLVEEKRILLEFGLSGKIYLVNIHQIYYLISKLFKFLSANNFKIVNFSSFI